VLRHLYDNEWVRLAALDPAEGIFYDYVPKQGWSPSSDAGPSIEAPCSKLQGIFEV
jgi:hypothetical protein